MPGRAQAGGGELHRLRARARRLEPVGQRAHGRARMHDHDLGERRRQHDGREVARRVVGQGAEQCRVYGQGLAGDQQRVTVGFRLGDRVVAEIAAGARAIVDHELLAEAIRQAAAERARQHVEAAARRERHDHTHRVIGITALGARAGTAGEREDDECQQDGKPHRRILSKDQGPRGQDADQGPRGQDADQGPRGQDADQGPRGQDADQR